VISCSGYLQIEFFSVCLTHRKARCGLVSDNTMTFVSPHVRVKLRQFWTASASGHVNETWHTLLYWPWIDNKFLEVINFISSVVLAAKLSSNVHWGQNSRMEKFALSLGGKLKHVSFPRRVIDSTSITGRPPLHLGEVDSWDPPRLRDFHVWQ
jgi:hypothetical protein